MTGIALQTAAGNDIQNEQEAQRSEVELTHFRALFEAKWRAAGCIMLTPSFLRYNCHGMTFAGRRTWVDNASLIPTILEEDGYQQVADKDVIPGDLVIYFDERGRAEHSGLVIEGAARHEAQLSVPKVLSKWGKAHEVVHWANRCPYELRDVRYYRLKKETVKT